MKKRKRFIPSFSEKGKRHWKSASWLAFVTIIFGLFPTWITLFMYRLFALRIGFQDIMDNGQFAIYSATLIASSLFFAAREFNIHRLKGRAGLILGLFVLMILSSLLVGSASISGKMSISIDYLFLRYSSIAIFLITIPVFFICALKNEAGVEEDYSARYETDYRAAREESLKKLGKKFKAPQKLTPPAGGEANG
jgi:hypothetical protein